MTAAAVVSTLGHDGQVSVVIYAVCIYDPKLARFVGQCPTARVNKCHDLALDNACSLSFCRERRQPNGPGSSCESGGQLGNGCLCNTLGYADRAS